MTQLPRSVTYLRLIACHMHVNQDLGAYLQLLQDRSYHTKDDNENEVITCQVELIWCDIQKVAFTGLVKDEVGYLLKIC